MDPDLHRRVEDLVTVLASCFGLIERHVGIAQQVACAGAVTDGDPNARVDHQWQRRRSLNLERLTYDLKQAVGDQLGVSTERGAVDQHNELVAAHPADRVDVAKGAL